MHIPQMEEMVQIWTTTIPIDEPETNTEFAKPMGISGICQSVIVVRQRGEDNPTILSAFLIDLQTSVYLITERRKMNSARDYTSIVSFCEP